MDKNFYQHHRAKEMQREISQELSNRQLLKGVKREPLPAKQAKRLLLYLAPVAIAITILLLLGLFG